MIGERRGPYEILAPIGAGGMGEVWKARDSRLGRIVAIKKVKEQHSERFKQEARSIAALNLFMGTSSNCISGLRRTSGEGRSVTTSGPRPAHPKRKIRDRMATLIFLNNDSISSLSSHLSFVDTKEAHRIYHGMGTRNTQGYFRYYLGVCITSLNSHLSGI